MTERQQRILDVALELFANNGYDATSTYMIAQRAKVSEALIFRHFKNKQGLLDAILTQADQRIQELIHPIINSEDPREVIRMAINLPYSVDATDHSFWRLQFILKWEEAYNNPDKMKFFIEKLTWAFEELAFKFPEYEARLLNQIVDGIAVDILQNGLDHAMDLRPFLLEKYELSS